MPLDLDSLVIPPVNGPKFRTFEVLPLGYPRGVNVKNHEKPNDQEKIRMKDVQHDVQEDSHLFFAF